MTCEVTIGRDPSSSALTPGPIGSQIEIVKRAAALLLVLLGGACAEPRASSSTEGSGAGSNEGAGTGQGGDGTANADGDCMTDAEEALLGTDPSLADSDGDGFDDCAERDCVSDPIDGAERCYTCGWKHGDPGTLVSTGASEGDVIANLALVDQCKEPLALWDFAGEYRLLFMTTSW